MTSYPTSQQISELLYKKFIGVPNAYPGTSYVVEFPDNSKNKITNNQVFIENIPSKAPTDITQDTTFVASSGRNGKKFKSTQYSYISYYEKLQLANVKTGKSYRYNISVRDENLCNNAIPFNYDPFDSSYNIRVHFKVKSTGQIIPTQIEPNDSIYPWIFDPDVGYLTFYGPTFLTDFIPLISFWRYEGKLLKDVPFGDIINNNSNNNNNSNITNNFQQLLITDTTDSTDTNNGAFVVMGGVGIGKNLNVGGNLSVKNAVSFKKSSTGTGVDVNVVDNSDNAFIIKDTTDNYIHISSLSKLLEIQQTLKLSKSFYESVTTITHNTSINEEGCIYRCDATTGDIIILLPQSHVSVGRNLKLIKVDNSRNKVRIIPYGTDTINGQGEIMMDSKHDNIKVTCDGFNWYTL